MKFQAGDKVRIKIKMTVDTYALSDYTYVVSRPSCDPRRGWTYSLRECGDLPGCYADGDFHENTLVLVGNGLQKLLQIKNESKI